MRFDELKDGDLEPDWHRYPQKGNLKRLDLDCAFSDELSQLIELMESSNKVQKALTEIALAELAIARKEKPDQHFEAADKLLKAVGKGKSLPGQLNSAQKSMQRVKGLK